MSSVSFSSLSLSSSLGSTHSTASIRETPFPLFSSPPRHHLPLTMPHLFFLSVSLSLLLLSLPLTLSKCHHCPEGQGECVHDKCVCIPYWQGDDCSLYDQKLSPPTSLPNVSVHTEKWKYFHVQVEKSGVNLLWTINHTSSKSDRCIFFVQRDDYPQKGKSILHDYSLDKVVEMEVEKAKEGKWYLGAFGKHWCEFTLTVAVEAASSCPKDCHSHGNCVKEKCVCHDGFAGESCQFSYKNLTSDVSQSGSVSESTWAYYAFSLTEQSFLEVIVTEVSSHPSNDCDIFLSMDHPPTQFDWEYSNITEGPVSTISLPHAVKGKYFLGVLGFSNCVYNVTSHIVPLSSSSCHGQCSLHGDCVRGVCTCRAGFVGELCEVMDDPLPLHETQIGFVSKRSWNYYHTRIVTQNALYVQLLSIGDGDCDLYVRKDDPPTQFLFDAVDLSPEANSSVTILQPGDHTWHIGVFGFEECKYSLIIEETIQCSCVKGLSHGKCLEGTHDCFCDAGWTGEDCSVSLVAATSGHKISAVVTKYQWTYYYIYLNHSSSGVISLKEKSTAGMLWLFASFTGTPSLTSFDFAEKSTLSKIHEISLPLAQQHSRSIVVGVYGSPYISRAKVEVPFDIILWISPF